MRVCDSVIQGNFVGKDEIHRVDALIPPELRGMDFTIKDKRQYNAILSSLPPKRAAEIEAELRHYYETARVVYYGKNQYLFEYGSIQELNKVRSLLKGAHRFILTKEFTQNPLNKLATPKGCAQAMSLFKLPYKQTWLEWREARATETRAGVLLSEREDGFVMCYVVLLFQLEDGTHHACIERIAFDPLSIKIDPEKGETLIAAKNISQNTTLNENFTSGICATLCEYIVRINSPHVTERRASDLSKINKKRIKKGNLPLLEHHVIDLSRRVREGLSLSGMVDEHGRRLHFRRGHFKVRKTGVFWWNEHLAGRKELGTITAEYKA